MSVVEPLARLRGNLSRPDWCAEAPGASHCVAGRRGCDVRLCHCAAVPLVAPGCRWESALWNDTNLPELHSLESPSNYAARN